MVVFLELVGACFLLVISLMSILWGIYFVKKNSGIVDIGWTVSFALTMLACVLIGDGWAPRKWLLACMVWIWSGRLFWHIYNRYISSEEDPRYQAIRETWGPNSSDFKFYLMFLFQGLLAVILSLPFMIVSMNTSNIWHMAEGWGVVIWLIGVGGEALADNQLKTFKQEPDNTGKVCQKGLWNYSRHPNYFFEFVTWIGYFVFALGTGWGIFAIISPALILFLLLKVSGIPMAEEQSLKTKGDAYREYQRSTSAFIPWFKK